MKRPDFGINFSIALKLCELARWTSHVNVFSLFDPATGAGLFFGVSVSLLAYGLMVHNQTRLLIFICYPFLFALVWALWSPLVMAAACFPPLMLIVLIKPQIALPIRDYAHHTFRHLSLHRCISWEVCYFIQDGQRFGFLRLAVISGFIRGQRRWDHSCS